MTLKQLQQWVDEDWKNRSSHLPDIHLQLLYIMEELGEVAEAVRKTSGNKERISKDVDLGSEIADLVISITTLANHFEVDIETEIEKFQLRLQKRHEQE